MIRAFFVLLFFVLFFLGFIPVQIVIFIVRAFKPETASWMTYHVIRKFLKFELLVSGTTVRAEGVENIPDNEAVLFVGNHRSDYDVLTIYTNLKAPAGFIAKKEMRVIPIMAQWMVLLECLFLDRQNPRAGVKTINEAAEKLKKGTSIFIFPEGTRNRGEDKNIPQEFKNGSLKIAQKAGCRIVPVVVKDTENIFEAHVPYIRPATVTVRFCPPVAPTEFPEEYKKDHAGYIRKIIADNLQEMVKAEG